MAIKTPHASPIRGFALGTKKSTQTLPVRTLIVNTDAPFGSDAYDRAVKAAALAEKKAAQWELAKERKENANARDIE